MKNATILPIAFSLLFSAAATAQTTQLVIGDVDIVKNTTNVFRLDCTNVLLTSTKVNLKLLHDNSRQKNIEYEMQVTDVSKPGQQILNVVSAKAIPEIFDMGNIRLGRSDTWELFGKPGAAAGIFITLPSLTSYAPVGTAGAWLTGTGSILFAKGKIDALGRFQIRYQPPNNSSLVGLTVTGQGVTIDGAKLMLANADCRTVRSK